MKLPRTVSVCGLTYRLIVVPRGSRGPKGWTNGRQGHEALTDIEQGTIHFSYKLLRNPTRLRDALVHELFHALSEATGLRCWLKKITRGRARAEKTWELEEDVIRILTPALITTFQSAGLLR